MGRLSNGRRTVFIKDGYPSIGGGEKEWAKLLWEVLVHILQVSLIEGPVSRLIGAAAAPGTQTAQCLTPPAMHTNVKTTEASSRIACGGASAKKLRRLRATDAR